MTYEEACAQTLTRRQALTEIQDHGANIEEFDDDVGVEEHYLGKIVLDWLGY